MQCQPGATTALPGLLVVPATGLSLREPVLLGLLAGVHHGSLHARRLAGAEPGQSQQGQAQRQGIFVPRCPKYAHTLTTDDAASHLVEAGMAIAAAVAAGQQHAQRGRDQRYGQVERRAPGGHHRCVHQRHCLRQQDGRPTQHSPAEEAASGARAGQVGRSGGRQLVVRGQAGWRVNWLCNENRA